jgi:hypothetical protein
VPAGPRNPPLASTYVHVYDEHVRIFTNLNGFIRSHECIDISEYSLGKTLKVKHKKEKNMGASEECLRGLSYFFGDKARVICIEKILMNCHEYSNK